MDDKFQALYSFFNGFGYSAYEVGGVPKNATFPYITYTSATGSIDDVIQIDASVWDLGETWERVDEIVNRIERFLNGMGCPKIKGGRYHAYKGSPYAQRLPEPENNIKRTVLHINFEFMTE